VKLTPLTFSNSSRKVGTVLIASKDFSEGPNDCIVASRDFEESDDREGASCTEESVLAEDFSFGEETESPYF